MNGRGVISEFHEKKLSLSYSAFIGHKYHPKKYRDKANHLLCESLCFTLSI